MYFLNFARGSFVQMGFLFNTFKLFNWLFFSLKNIVKCVYLLFLFKIVPFCARLVHHCSTLFERQCCISPRLYAALKPVFQFYIHFFNKTRKSSLLFNMYSIVGSIVAIVHCSKFAQFNTFVKTGQT